MQMRMPGSLIGRRWRRGVVVGLALAGGLGGLAAWSSRDPSPPRATFRGPEASRPQGFAPDGRTVLTSGPEGVVAWDAATWRARPPWALRAFKIAAFSRDGRTCLGEHGYDPESAKLCRVDVATGAILDTFAAGQPQVYHLDFGAGDGSARALLADRSGKLREAVAWDLATGAATRRPLLGPTRLGWYEPFPAGVAPGGRVVGYVAKAPDGVQLWDVEADAAIGPPLVNPGAPLAWHGNALAFSPDGTRLAVAREDGAIDLWDLPARARVATIVAHAAGISPQDLHFAPDGRTLASTGSYRRPTGWVDRSAVALRALAFGGNPALPGDGVVVVDVATGRRLARWPTAFQPRFAPDGRSIVTHESWDGTFAVRDAPTSPNRQD